MDIEKLIKTEAPGDNPHDVAYGNALREAYEEFKNYDSPTLREYQEMARVKYRVGGATHDTVAELMVILQLLEPEG